MSIKRVLSITVAVSITVFGLISCGGSKTSAVKKTSSRGELREQESCEAMAFEGPIRASGNSISQNEQHGTNAAMLQARSELARQLEVFINGMDRGFSQEHVSGQTGSSFVGSSRSVSQNYFEQFLRNSRPICKNVYDMPDGRLNIYVTVELGDQEKKVMFNQLKKDEMIAIDFAEHQFLQELEKSKDDFRKQRSNQ